MSTLRVANAPCSWGAFEFSEAGAGTPAYARVLDEMREAGYVGTELGDWGFMPTDPEALAAALASRGLDLVGAFVPVRLADASTHEEGAARAVRTARLLAAVTRSARIVLSDDNGSDPVRKKLAGSIRKEHGLSADAWRTFARGAERVAQAVKEQTGAETVFHHHCGGFVETPEEVATLLRSTSPELVGLCLDTGHWTFGGGDPLAALEEHGARVRHVHFKDADPAVMKDVRAAGRDYVEAVGAGVFCELGRGAVDFARLLELLRGRSYGGWIVVEQDVFPGMGDPLESAKRSRAYLRSLGLT
jgi:inosose dehydratase